MGAVAERDLLTLWEQSEGADPLGRAAVLLAAALPDIAARDQRQLTVGQRDAALLEFHGHVFGACLQGFVACPGCEDALELELAESQVQAILAAKPAHGEQVLTVGEFELHFRALTCADLDTAVDGCDPHTARLRLINRCVLDARAQGTPVEPAALPEGVLSTLAARLAECDPQAEIRVSVECPECGHAWRPQIDIATFLSAEIDSAAVRLLEDVSALASRYGWSEDDVLGMSHRRRQFYLESSR